MTLATPTLFDAPGPSHRGDPHTSKDAARLVSSATRRRILAAFLDGALTDDEAGERSGVANYSQRRRCSELRSWGLIERTGETRPTASGAKAVVCRITEAGRRALAEGGDR